MKHAIGDEYDYTPIEQFGETHPNDIKRKLSQFYHLISAAQKLIEINDERVLICADWHEIKKILRDIKDYE